MPVSAFQQGATYTAIAKITSVLSLVKWYYIACHRCDKGYNYNTESQTCACEVSFPKPMYKLHVTITDKSGSLDAMAFSFVAEDLVELDAAHASQNMKIDSFDHPTALNNAIGKRRLFTVGMNMNSSSKFPISYVLKRSFPIDSTMEKPMLTCEEPSKKKDLLQLPAPTTYTSSSSTPVKDTTVNKDSTPTEDFAADISTKKNSIMATKRSIDFSEDSVDKTMSTNKPDPPVVKHQKEETRWLKNLRNTHGANYSHC
ncbi:uncharacterized protein LOC102702404 [Oryza brachyantha]|uniref:uncharacterized protein LOC102702404 n=1 Tax=Oryza brachyantha TaxID=4533 RepID=UPI001AD9E255|nr:uncharacterized protein LOC102702404 [Oryza brachyantha]